VTTENTKLINIVCWENDNQLISCWVSMSVL